jgi:hypothetical protein
LEGAVCPQNPINKIEALERLIIKGLFMKNGKRLFAFCLICLSVVFQSRCASKGQSIISETDVILADQGANLWRGFESVGGRITVTNEFIKFIPHAFNSQTYPLEIALNTVSRVEKSNSYVIIPNQMVIILESGVEYRFVLNRRNRLVNLIKGLL